MICRYYHHLSHMPSVEQKSEFHHALWLEEHWNIPEHCQEKIGSVEQRLYGHTWTDPESNLKMTPSQGSFFKKTKRNSMMRMRA